MINPLYSSAREHLVNFTDHRMPHVLRHTEIFWKYDVVDIPEGYHAVVTVELVPNVTVSPLVEEMAVA